MLDGQPLEVGDRPVVVAHRHLRRGALPTSADDPPLPQPCRLRQRPPLVGELAERSPRHSPNASSYGPTARPAPTDSASSSSSSNSSTSTRPRRVEDYPPWLRRDRCPGSTVRSRVTGTCASSGRHPRAGPRRATAHRPADQSTPPCPAAARAGRADAAAAARRVEALPSRSTSTGPSTLIRIRPPPPSARNLRRLRARSGCSSDDGTDTAAGRSCNRSTASMAGDRRISRPRPSLGGASVRRQPTPIHHLAATSCAAALLLVGCAGDDPVADAPVESRAPAPSDSAPTQWSAGRRTRACRHSASRRQRAGLPRPPMPTASSAEMEKSRAERRLRLPVPGTRGPGPPPCGNHGTAATAKAHIEILRGGSGDVSDVLLAGEPCIRNSTRSWHSVATPRRGPAKGGRGRARGRLGQRHTPDARASIDTSVLRSPHPTKRVRRGRRRDSQPQARRPQASRLAAGSDASSATRGRADRRSVRMHVVWASERVRPGRRASTRSAATCRPASTSARGALQLQLGRRPRCSSHLRRVRHGSNLTDERARTRRLAKRPTFGPIDRMATGQ